MTILVQRFVVSRWPRDHAGVRMGADEEGSPIITVGIVDSVPDDEAFDAIRREYPGSYPLNIIHMQTSFNDLNQYAEDLFLAGLDNMTEVPGSANRNRVREERRAEWRRSLQRVNFPLGSAVDIDTRNNQISVWTAEDLPQALPVRQSSQRATYPDGTSSPSRQEAQASNFLTEMVGIPVRVVENAAPEPATHDCSGRWFCDPNMIGGLGIRATSTLGIPHCSTGFAAYGASGRRFAITAGHCGAGTRWWNGGVRYGTLEQAVYGGYVDQGRIVWDSNNWQHYGEIWLGTGGERTRRITSFMRWADLPEGQPNYFIGVSAGRTDNVFRGLVDSKHLRFQPQPGLVLERGISLSPGSSGAVCVAGGDSGSPLFRNNVAVGVLHGFLQGIPCSDSRHRAVGTSIEYGLNALNLYLIYG